MFGEKKFVEKIVTSTILEFGKFFRILGTKLREACQNFIVHFRRTFWGETTLLGKRTSFSSFPQFEQNVIRVLTRIFLTVWSQLDSACPDEDFFIFLKEWTEGENYFLRTKLHCYPFGTLREKDSPCFCGMVKAGLSKLRYTCSDEHFNK